MGDAIQNKQGNQRVGYIIAVGKKGRAGTVRRIRVSRCLGLEREAGYSINKAVRAGFIEKVIFEQRLQEMKLANQLSGGVLQQKEETEQRLCGEGQEFSLDMVRWQTIGHPSGDGKSEVGCMSLEFGSKVRTRGKYLGALTERWRIKAQAWTKSLRQ